MYGGHIHVAKWFNQMGASGDIRFSTCQQTFITFAMSYSPLLL
jgi:hypothetical protein